MSHAGIVFGRRRHAGDVAACLDGLYGYQEQERPDLCAQVARGQARRRAYKQSERAKTSRTSRESENKQTEQKQASVTVSVSDTVSVTNTVTETGNVERESEGESALTRATHPLDFPEGSEFSDYGEFAKVRLTTNEREKLSETLGDEAAETLIQQLDSYIASSGKQYRSHYATLLRWAKKDGETSARASPVDKGGWTNARASPAAITTEPDYDFYGDGRIV